MEGAAVPAGIGTRNRHSERDTASSLIGAFGVVGPTGLSAVVTFFAVFGEVQTDGFDFLIDPQADDGLDDGSDDGGADDGEQDCEDDGLDLLADQGLEEGIFDVILEVGGEVAVGGIAGEATGEESPHGGADGVNAEGIEGVIVDRKSTRLNSSHIPL